MPLYIDIYHQLAFAGAGGAGGAIIYLIVYLLTIIFMFILAISLIVFSVGSLVNKKRRRALICFSLGILFLIPYFLQIVKKESSPTKITYTINTTEENTIIKLNSHEVETLENKINNVDFSLIIDSDIIKTRADLLTFKTTKIREGETWIHFFGVSDNCPLFKYVEDNWHESNTTRKGNYLFDYSKGYNHFDISIRKNLIKQE